MKKLFFIALLIAIAWVAVTQSGVVVVPEKSRGVIDRDYNSDTLVILRLDTVIISWGGADDDTFFISHQADGFIRIHTGQGLIVDLDTLTDGAGNEIFNFAGSNLSVTAGVLNAAAGAGFWAFLDSTTTVHVNDSTGDTLVLLGVDGAEFRVLSDWTAGAPLVDSGMYVTLDSAAVPKGADSAHVYGYAFGGSAFNNTEDAGFHHIYDGEAGNYFGVFITTDDTTGTFGIPILVGAKNKKFGGTLLKVNDAGYGNGIHISKAVADSGGGVLLRVEDFRGGAATGIFVREDSTGTAMVVRVTEKPSEGGRGLVLGDNTDSALAKVVVFAEGVFEIQAGATFTGDITALDTIRASRGIFDTVDVSGDKIIDFAGPNLSVTAGVLGAAGSGTFADTSRFLVPNQGSDTVFKWITDTIVVIYGGSHDDTLRTYVRGLDTIETNSNQTYGVVADYIGDPASVLATILAQDTIRNDADRVALLGTPAFEWKEVHAQNIVADSFHSALAVYAERLWVATSTNDFRFPRTVGTADQVLKLDVSATPDTLYWANDAGAGAADFADTSRFLVPNQGSDTVWKWSTDTVMADFGSAHLDTLLIYPSAADEITMTTTAGVELLLVADGLGRTGANDLVVLADTLRPNDDRVSQLGTLAFEWGEVFAENFIGDSAAVLALQDAIVDEPDLVITNSPADNDILTANTGGNDFTWETPTGTGNILRASAANLFRIGIDSGSGAQASFLTNVNDTVVFQGDSKIGLTFDNQTVDTVNFRINAASLVMADDFAAFTTANFTSVLSDEVGTGFIILDDDVLRVDGSNPLEANWAAGDFDATGFEALEADTVTATVVLSGGASEVNDPLVIEADTTRPDDDRNTVLGTAAFEWRSVFAQDFLGDSAGVLALHDNIIDSNDVIVGALAETDMNWHPEWITLDNVHGMGRALSDSIYLHWNLQSPNGDTTILLRDSAGNITVGDDDTVNVSGMIPFDCTMDSLEIRYRISSGSEIIDVWLRGPDLSTFVNQTDSIWFASATDLTSTTWATAAYALGSESVDAGYRFSLKYIVNFDADNDRLLISSIRVRCIRRGS